MTVCMQCYGFAENGHANGRGRLYDSERNLIYIGGFKNDRYHGKGKEVEQVYDAYFDYFVMGPLSSEMQAYQTNLTISAALAWGAPFILFWEMYNNEHERIQQGDGFWLIDEQNRKQPVYYLHENYLAKLQFLCGVII